MIKVIAVIMILLLVPVPPMAQEQEQETKQKRVLIFPFRMKTKDSVDTFSNEVAAALGAELSREGDVNVLSGGQFVEAVRLPRVDPARLERIAGRIGAEVVAWGSVSKLEDGYSLEVWALDTKRSDKPRLFTATGKDMQELVAAMKDLAVDIGGAVLDRPKIGKIHIEGNRRVQTETILNRVEMKPGTQFRKSAIGEDIRRIYDLGYFDDVQIRAEKTPTGEIDLNIEIKERPFIKEIEISGNTVFTADQILDRLLTKRLNVASVEKIRDDIQKVKKMYEKEGYYEPKIDYEIKELSRDEANLIFTIDEGVKSYLTEIVLEGRKSIPEKELKKILNVKEKTWFWLIDDSGTFTSEKLEEDRMRLIAYYLDHGFVQVQVGAPQIDIKDGRAKVTYPIREGQRFQVRKVDVTGELIVPEEKLKEELKTGPRTWVKRSLIAEDIQALQRLYNNMGYAYVDIAPRQKANEEHNFIDISYEISKGERVSIERVDIVGNDRTRDKVIRRSLAINEGDLYNADKFENTKKNLQSMDYFEGVQIQTAPGSRPDLMNVTVQVSEKKTGSLAAGLGYSSQDGAMGNVDLKERNLFGMGIVANVKANLSGRKNNYEGSVTYPWLFDYPLTGSARGYRAVQRETQFVREGEGLSLHLGFPLYGAWSMDTGIGRDSSKVSQFERVYALSVVDYYKRYNTVAQRFLNVAENSVTVGFGRDTRIGHVIPRGGSKISIGSRISGFGGDVAFQRYFTEATYYYPLLWQAIFKVRANGSLLQESGSDPIPFDRRLVLGGIQSIRGYQNGEIGPRDKYGSIIGGDRSLFANAECLFPLVESMNLNGVVFADAGNSWNVEDGPFLDEVKAGAGVGIRWMSPMGPIRLEYGWKINPAKGEEPGAFAFAMGQLF
ncbi:MAG: outer membrane protein assembly factor BamA [Desulfomonilaceae bacterium]|nr:outer membrane protein assembly factor BamA [Desulfomonilaceae bacterium]